MSSKKLKIKQLKEKVLKIRYSVEELGNFKLIGILIILLTIILLGKSRNSFNLSNKIENTSYLVLFIVGIFTSLHCVGRCGNIMLSQNITLENKSRFQVLKPAIFYNLGRVTSYTILGGIAGALGSVVSITLPFKGRIQIIACVFMIILGLNMSEYVPFRRLNIKLPWSACNIKKSGKTPFIVGILNGVMPCGILQTMQLYAFGTGSAVTGATSMFIFVLGTVPLMISFGTISSLLNKKNTKQLVKFGGILIVVLGLIMGDRGLSLSGINISPLALMGNSNKQSDTNVVNNSSIVATADDTKTSTIATDSNSIFGSDLNKTPINILAKKATINDDTQSLTISGIGYEFSPIISAVQSGLKSDLTIELTNFNNALGLYSIVDVDSKTISSFEGKKGINQISLTFDNPGIYRIIKDKTPLGLIDVTKDIKTIVLEDLRETYLKEK
ncbi:sulfite exporter TauE/SafE family protein [Clostridium lacusfryxellense]|uniref:sulfite exporter TauE/SafE family protein n=1 Tax=Clostridium lacusfryxellense TaxID=205328 RepID=UPI001C0C4181|nr:sulfite exporter TauE/SafE family protein [Clostridium lacusfryxellense]MBU3110265.1 sulfite exporter TauE/SafE family protein [Clostridium lacusfryxellense]